MRIQTDRGKTFEVKWCFQLSRNPNALNIEYRDERPFAEIAADFDGVNTITKVDDTKPEKEKPYTGFTKLTGINRLDKKGTVRLTLERGDGA